MAAKLFSVYLLAIAGLEVIRAAPLTLSQRNEAQCSKSQGDVSSGIDQMSEALAQLAAQMEPANCTVLLGNDTAPPAVDNSTAPLAVDNSTAPLAVDNSTAPLAVDNSTAPLAVDNSTALCDPAQNATAGACDAGAVDAGAEAAGAKGKKGKKGKKAKGAKAAGKKREGC